MDDLNSPDGIWDVSRLTTVPRIYSSFSSSEDTDLQYRVIAPEAGSPLWEHGLPVLPPGAIGDGDNFVPAYSANLKRVTALAGAPNIEDREESSLLGDEEIVPLTHLTIVERPEMVRQILFYFSSLQTDIKFWDADPPVGFPSVLGLFSCSPVRILATDPLGRQAGLDLDTGQVVNQIPGAFVSGPDEAHQLIWLPDPAAGQYHIIPGAFFRHPRDAKVYSPNGAYYFI